MNRLNRKVEYALMALKMISDQPAGQLTSAQEVVDRLSIPFDATARVLQVLAQYRVLKSEHGAQGGYRLQRDLNHLSLYELMEMVLGPVAVAKCMQEGEGCDLKKTCNIASPIAEFNHQMELFYRNLNVGQLFLARGLNRKDATVASGARA